MPVVDVGKAAYAAICILGVVPGSLTSGQQLDELLQVSCPSIWMVLRILIWLTQSKILDRSGVLW